jgi:hypothetical protein
MSRRRRSASAGSFARRRRTAADLRSCRVLRNDFIDIDALREALDLVRAHNANFPLDDRIAWTSSLFPDQFETGPDRADGTNIGRWELQNKAELQNS